MEDEQVKLTVNAGCDEFGDLLDCEGMTLIDVSSSSGCGPVGDTDLVFSGDSARKRLTDEEKRDLDSDEKQSEILCIQPGEVYRFGETLIRVENIYVSDGYQHVELLSLSPHYSEKETELLQPS